MKVLENRAVITVECTYCQSTLQILESDIRVEEQDAGHIGAEFHVVCGACHKDFALKYFEVPNTWMDRLLRKI